MREHHTIAAALFNRGKSVDVRAVEDTGCVAFDKRGRVVALAAPAHARTPLARIVHAHELLHSRFSAGSFGSTLSHQIAEDCIIHVAAHSLADRNGGGAVPHLWRDALHVALTDALSALRALRSGVTGDMRERARGTLIRSAWLPFLALASRKGPHAERLQRIQSRLWDRTVRVLCADRPTRLAHDFGGYVSTVADNLAHQSIRQRVRKSDRESVRRMREIAYGLATALITDPDPRTGPQSDPRDGDGVAWMEPPLTHQCAPPLTGMRRVPMAVGARIRTHRLAAVATGTESRPFTTRMRTPDVSAVVLDLSSSMEWDDATLARLCSVLPRTNVYGYCNHRPNGRDVDGTIVRLAANGRRVAAIPRLAGGNGCDMQAVELALRHTGRVVFVTDRGFGGQSPDRTERAHALLKANPRIHVIESRDDALKHFNA